MEARASAAARCVHHILGTVIIVSRSVVALRSVGGCLGGSMLVVIIFSLALVAGCWLHVRSYSLDLVILLKDDETRYKPVGRSDIPLDPLLHHKNRNRPLTAPFRK